MGVCLVCKIYVEGTETLTCGHPQCVGELKEVHERLEIEKMFLRRYDCEDFEDLKNHIRSLEVTIAKLKGGLRDIIMTAEKALKLE